MGSQNSVATKKTAFCRFCGNRVEENAKFCTNCGERLDIPASVQPTQNSNYQNANQPVQNKYAAAINNLFERVEQPTRQAFEQANKQINDLRHEQQKIQQQVQKERHQQPEPKRQQIHQKSEQKIQKQQISNNTPDINANTEDYSTRKTYYEGTIHKCPNCGETVPSFSTVCKTCGYEFRDMGTTRAIAEFQQKLEAIDNKKQKGLLASFGGSSERDKERKANIISSFPVPNTSEDIMEFFFLSSSHLNSQTADAFAHDPETKAWMSKFEQVYQKAKLVLSDPVKLSEIESMYSKTKRRVMVKKYGLGILLGVLSVLLFGFIFTMAGLETHPQITVFFLIFIPSILAIIAVAVARIYFKKKKK